LYRDYTADGELFQCRDWQHSIWIPVKFAVIGKRLKTRKTTSDKWEDGWIVGDVYFPSRTVEVEDSDSCY